MEQRPPRDHSTKQGRLQHDQQRHVERRGSSTDCEVLYGRRNRGAETATAAEALVATVLHKNRGDLNKLDLWRHSSIQGGAARVARSTHSRNGCHRARQSAAAGCHSSCGRSLSTAAALTALSSFLLASSCRCRLCPSCCCCRVCCWRRCVGWQCWERPRACQTARWR